MIQEAMNTLYVQTEGAILRLDHDNVVVTWKGDQNRSSSPETGQERSLRIPLHHLQGIVVLGRALSQVSWKFEGGGLLNPFGITGLGTTRKENATYEIKGTSNCEK
ncbi:CRISPR-associated endonuclease Cas1 [Kyrpidia spormannii]|uniref:CRISPR-associated endonuclease Cas1 n=1 Tax=Kyrpidia spormannii TaxID=2055160 RepID=UPI0010555F84|nr:CRISPR-associated endonuclease Cas1 [Kyrpidia spormannii]